MGRNESFIRWAGGKSWLIPYVQKLTKDLTFNNYIEPFMGGASMFFALDIQRTAYLSDVNDELVNAFEMIKTQPERVLRKLQEYQMTEQEFYRVRAMRPKSKIGQAARFIYLNATDYNGMYRVNKKGEFNVPYGKRQVIFEDSKYLNASAKLQNTVLTVRDFYECLSDVNTNDLVFLDPPYAVNKEESGFIEYNSTLFSIDDQKRLADLIREIDNRGAYYIMTNISHPDIAEIFSGIGRRVELERSSTLGGKGAQRGKVKEYIFTNIIQGED